MADPLRHSATTAAACRATPWRAEPASSAPGQRSEAAALLRLYRDMAASADPDEAGVEADAEAASDDLRRRLAATAERLRNAERHALSREIGLLRELLSDRDKRIADKDGVIDGLRRRLAAADAERNATQRRLTGLLMERRASGRLRRAVEALGRVLDAVLTAPIEPPSRLARQMTEHPAASHEAARALAEQALLEQIARHHRRWARRGEGAV